MMGFRGVVQSMRMGVMGLVLLACIGSAFAVDYDANLLGKNYVLVTIPDPPQNKEEKLYVLSGDPNKKIKAQGVLPLLVDPEAMLTIVNPPEEALRIHAATLTGRTDTSPCLYRVYGHWVIEKGLFAGRNPYPYTVVNKKVIPSYWKSDYKHGATVGLIINDCMTLGDDNVTMATDSALFVSAAGSDAQTGNEITINLSDLDDDVGQVTFDGAATKAVKIGWNTTTVEGVQYDVWLDLVSVQLRGATIGRTTIKGELAIDRQTYSVVAARVCSIEIVDARSAHGPAGPVPVNASMAASLGGTGTVGEYKASMKVVGPAHAYKLKIAGSKVTGGGWITTDASVTTTVTGTGDSITGYSDPFILTGKANCTGLANAATITGRWNYTAGSQYWLGVEKTLISFIVYGEFSKPSVGAEFGNQFQTTPTAFPNVMNATSYLLYDAWKTAPPTKKDMAGTGSTIDGYFLPCKVLNPANEAFDDAALYNGRIKSSLDSMGTLSLGAIVDSCRADKNLARCTAGASSDHIMELRIKSAPAGVVDNLNATGDYNLRRTCIPWMSVITNQAGGANLSVSLGPFGTRISGDDSYKAMACWNAGWVFVDSSSTTVPSGGAIVRNPSEVKVKGVLSPLEGYFFNKKWGADSSVLIEQNLTLTCPIGALAGKATFRAAVGVTVHNDWEKQGIVVVASASRSYLRCEKPVVMVVSCTLSE